jgi:hypothetical protein
MQQAVVNRLLLLTNDLVKDVKIAAIQALGEGAPATQEVEARLMVLTNDLVKDVKVAAINALGRIYRKR